MSAALVPTREAARVMDVCNACRYCEGYCAVFQTMTTRRTFAESDLEYMSNLCHQCNACYHACQYAPPHEFAINVPRAMADLRAETYERFAWPARAASAFQRNGLVTAIAVSVFLALLLGFLLFLQDSTFEQHIGPGAFYAVISHATMVVLGSVSFGFAILAIGIGMRRFARSIGLGPVRLSHLRHAGANVAEMRYLGGHTPDGCNDIGESFSTARRFFHQSTLWGFVLCFASTCVATLYDYGFGWEAPYPVLSVPVLLGTIGGVGLMIGCSGLFVIKRRCDPAPVSPRFLGMDYAFLFLLFMVAATGLLLLAFRETTAMGLLLGIHLGFVLGFFVTMPYGKFVHGGYRFVALLKYAQEQ